MVLETLMEIQLAQSRSVTTPPNMKMVWKSRLKEYYDKKGRPGMEIKYKVMVLEQDRFVATVFIPELGEVKGESGRSKREAEQSAAKNALQRLQQENKN